MTTAGSSTLAGDGETPVVAGNLRAAEENGPDLSTSIALYDTVAGTSRAVDLGVGFSNMVITEGQLVVIGLDGHLHLIDLLSGEVRTIPAIDPWERPAEFLDPRPMVTASHDHGWITDPFNEQIVAVDITDGEVVASGAVGGKPDRLVVANYTGDEHDHD